jgi:ABC-type branched-subunit amino acid transport system substrate-binding protein
VFIANSLPGPAWAADLAPVHIAAALSLSGPGDFYGLPALDGATLAVEEANADRNAPRVELAVSDDHSNPGQAAAGAQHIAGTSAVAVIGPSLTVTALKAGATYAAAGLACIVPTAHGDDVPAASTTFQPIFNTGRMGSALATYLYHVLGGRHATVVYRDDGFGRPFAAGFRAAASSLGVDITLHPFTTEAERAGAIRQAAAESGHKAVALGILSADAVPLLEGLRRAGVTSPILGPDSIGGDGFAALFASEPEEMAHPGFFTDNLYAAAPILFDSANQDTLDFARRFHDRFGHDPTWSAVQGFDVARLAIDAARRAALEAGPDASTKTLRAAVLARLASFNGPTHAMAGVTGPLWFTPGRGRDQTVRIGRFRSGLFESAPVQLVPAATPEPADLASGAVIALPSGDTVRRQRVVYTGVFLNQISHVDVALAKFTADLYLWVRYDPLVPGADPAAIDFPDLARGSSEGKLLAEQMTLDDGLTYRLWRIRGDFKNAFDLHHYPADVQSLHLRFYNADGDSTRIVYVQDRRTEPAAVSAGTQDSRFDGVAERAAFRDLTQWRAEAVQARRDDLVTHSSLGDPRTAGQDRTRELSGFTVTIELRRRVVATLVKTLLPLILMAMVMYATLHFPPVLIKEKVTVAVTSALTGAVLLSAINTQLGTVGYVMDVEFVFYIYFVLCLLAIVSALIGERWRSAGRSEAALRVERAGQFVFVVALAGVAGTTAFVLAQ